MEISLVGFVVIGWFMFAGWFGYVFYWFEAREARRDADVMYRLWRVTRRSK